MSVTGAEKIAQFNSGKMKRFTKVYHLVKIKAITTWHKFRGKYLLCCSLLILCNRAYEKIPIYCVPTIFVLCFKITAVFI